MHRVTRPIHRAIGIGVGGQTGIRIVAQVPCAGRINRELVRAGCQHRNVFQLRPGQACIHQTLLVGSLGRNFFWSTRTRTMIPAIGSPVRRLTTKLISRPGAALVMIAMSVTTTIV